MTRSRSSAESAVHSYTAYGLGLTSEIELAGLAPGDGPPDVAIRLGPLPLLEPTYVLPGMQVSASATAVQIDYEGFARIRIAGGDEIVVDPAPGADPATVRVFVLAGPLGLLLRQRGLLVLHASGVAIDGVAVAVCGASGWGKSTLTAALQARGHPLVADDIFAVRLDAGRPVAVPGIPRLKLHPDAVTALGGDPAALPQLFPGVEKREHLLDTGYVTEPLPLAGLYVLAEGESEAVEVLSSAQAVAEVTRHTYGILSLQASGTSANHLRQAAQLVSQVPVMLLRRPRSLALLPRLAELVEDAARTR